MAKDKKRIRTRGGKRITVVIPDPEECRCISFSCIRSCVAGEMECVFNGRVNPRATDELKKRAGEYYHFSDYSKKELAKVTS